MYNVHDLPAVKSRLNRFWRHESIGRPYVLLTAPKKNTPPAAVDLSYVRRVRDAARGDFTSAVRDFEKWAQTIVHYGESLPQYSADLCPDQYAAFFGAEIVAREGEITTWIGKNLAEAELGFIRRLLLRILGQRNRNLEHLVSLHQSSIFRRTSGQIASNRSSIILSLR